MGKDRRHDKDSSETNELLRDILETEERILHVDRKIEYDLSRISKVAAVQFSGDSIMPNNVLALTVGQSSTASPITFLADGVTASGAIYSAATYTFSDPSAILVPNADGVTALVTGVAPSTGAVSGSVSFTATDTDSAVSQWTVPFTITVNAPPPPAQLSQSAAVQFSTPA